jgi:DNA-binding transcriptional regulator GbsR (MarR family)
LHIHGKRKKFVELVEKVMVRWGYTNTEGMIYGILLISEKPMSINDFLKITDLSRTSISTSLKRLAHDELVDVNKIKRVKYFTPNPAFTRKFMEQPRELLSREIIPMLQIINSLLEKANSEEQREKLEEIRKELENLKELLKEIIEIEEKKFRTLPD